MKKYFLIVIVFIAFNIKARAQYEAVQEGEYGISAGVAHYFGDLNNRAAFNRPKIALGAFYRKQFNSYAGVRLTAHFAQLGYSDQYSQNAYQRSRNLSFNTNIFEVALRGDFNFFQYNPTDPNHSFTPYATIGVGVFSYDPYAYLAGQKYFLRPLDTEGETFYKGRKEYGTMAVCIPVGMGVKYAVSDKVNISFEIAYRFTTTDYIDDVSTTYVGIDKFPVSSVAAQLQDRSYELGTPIGIEGRQRGFSKQKDSYAIAEFGISFNIISYRCPSAQ
jgi:opacity protein-like surface antigen